MLCSDKDAGPELELARAGLALYDELEARLGDEARIRRKGALIVHPEATTWAGEAARVARVGIAGGAAAGSGRGARAGAGADRRRCAARASSRTTCSAIRARSRGRSPARPPRPGADVRDGLRGRPPCRRPRVVLRNGEQVTADAVVLAAGAWSRGARRGRRAAAAARAAQGPARPARRARAGPGPAQGRRRLLPALGPLVRQRARGHARSWRRRGRATCSSARRASGAASTRPSTPP